MQSAVVRTVKAFFIARNNDYAAARSFCMAICNFCRGRRLKTVRGADNPKGRGLRQRKVPGYQAIRSYPSLGIYPTPVGMLYI
jgi:hypothetical protein